MYQFLIIFLLIGSSFQLNNDVNVNEKSSFSNETKIDHLSDRPTIISTVADPNLRETRSNSFLDSFKNSNLKKTNPHLLQYFANKENHIFHDIMRKLTNENNATNQTSINQNNENKSEKLVYEVNTEIYHDNNNYHKTTQPENKPNFEPELESMYAHETQNTDSKDPMSKYAQIKELISTTDDNNRNLGKLPSISGHYVPAEPFGNGDFHELLSCCDQLFQKYGNKNYLHEDIYILPRMDGLSRFPSAPFDAQRHPIFMGYHQSRHQSAPRFGGYPIFDPEQQQQKIPLMIPKDFPKDKITEIECLDHFHNMHSHLIPVHPIDPGHHHGNFNPTSRIDSTGPLPHHGHLIPIHSIVDHATGGGSTHGPSLNSANVGSLIHHHSHSIPNNRIDSPMVPQGHLIPAHHLEGQRTINGIHSHRGHGFPIGYNDRLFSPVQANNRLLMSNNGQSMLQRRTGNLMSPPSMFPVPSVPGTSSNIFSRKLSLLGKKYLLG